MKPKAFSYIRFSTPEQKIGDSTRRQIELAEEYAKHNGLELDTALNMRDEGLSGYHGRHIAKGALGAFLTLIKDGKIPRGSLLIVESFDRLTRQPPSDAERLLMDLRDAGVAIRILDRHITITKETYNNDPGVYWQVVGELRRAYEESKRKSELLKAAWDNKRKQAIAGQQKMTGQCPAWLKLSKTKKDFEVIKEPAKAVRMIFELKNKGYGNGRIARHLNELSNIWHPPKSGRNKTGGWRESYIQKILHTPAVIGEYQPHMKINGKRIPSGEPITNYYPAIIDKDLFFAVHNRLKRFREMNGHPGGRTGKMENLFMHLAKCGRCGSSMHFVDKGNSSKGGKYLRCDVSQRNVRDDEGNRICDAKAIRYDEFERIFFDEFEELDINTLLPDPDETQIGIEQLERTFSANLERIDSLKQNITNLADSIASTQSKEVRETLETRLHQIIQEQKGLTGENEKLRRKKTELQKEALEMREQFSNVKKIYELRGATKTEKDRINLQIRLRAEIRKLVHRIDIYPLTAQYKHWQKLDDEPGLYLHMTSHYIEKIRIRFHGGDTQKRIIYLKRYAVEEGLDTGEISNKN